MEHLQTADLVTQWGVASEVDFSPEQMVRMRDGVRLSTDVLIPKGLAPPFPTILIRTPYPKVRVFPRECNLRLLHIFIDNGYAIVVQFERGTYASEGEYHILSGARRDGYDTISWIVSQPWSNGRVGTYGCSSMGENQMALSAENHPAHKAMIALAAGAGIGDFPGVSSQGLFYRGGIPWLEFFPWYHVWGYVYRPQLPRSLSDDERSRLAQVYVLRTGEPDSLPLLPSAAHLPSKDILRVIGTPTTDWDRFMQRAPGDEAWKAEEFLTAEDNPQVPALFVNSWYDVGAHEVVKAFEYQQRRAPHQYLLMGTTRHCFMGTETKHTMVGERDVGDARYHFNERYLQWFDYWLKEMDNGALGQPRVEYYVPSANQWRTAEAWPPPVSQYKLYLHSALGANSSRGDGSLDAEVLYDIGSDTYRYDPVDPVPSVSRLLRDSVVSDQKAVAARQDVLVYTSGILKSNLDIVGEVSAILYVSTSVLDTDLLLRLVDVYPDDRAHNVGDVVLRLRYREGFRRPELMTPGVVYRIELRGLSTATRFIAGHRIRIQVTSSDFPVLERNLNTGGENSSEVSPVAAETQIYHGRSHPSHLSLPVLLG
jgi:uncharacterized protein